MKPFTTSLLIIGGLCLSGCDGSISRLYVMPPDIPTPKEAHSTALLINRSIDLIPVVEQVAHELHMQASPEEPQSWYIYTTQKNVFMMKIKKDVGGYWIIGFFEWPNLERSKQSKWAEGRIREILGKTPTQ